MERSGELEIMCRAYQLLLQMPLGLTRVRLDGALAALRDQIAEATGQTREQVQNNFEARASLPHG